MTRRCSHCSNNGHNSRTCPNRGVRLFGVRLTDGSIRKSASMGNLTHYAGSAGGGGGGGGGTGGNTPGSPAADGHDGGSAADGYASEDFVQGSSSSCRDRKKGTPWTEEEHRMFLLGLQKLGKGDWRGIARNFVVSRTPTQVASHAQKYFIRQANSTKRKRRSSLFDIVADESVDTPPLISQELFPISHEQPEAQSTKPLVPPVLDEEGESMDSAPSIDEEVSTQVSESLPCSYPVYPAYFPPPFIPFPVPFWGAYGADAVERETHEIVKPTAVHSKAPINVDQLVGLSKLSLGESADDSSGPGHMAPSSLTLKLLDGSSRQSAFHANPSPDGANMNSGSAIHAV